MTTAQEIMKLFTDKKTLQIFNTIAKLNGDDRIILLSALGLTNKRFYTRIHLLKYAGLVKKIDRYYHLTAFGKCILKITCDAELQMTIAIKNYYNYVVIDSMSKTDIPEQEQQKIQDDLFAKKEMLLA